jgi:hypothetical protein
MYGVWSVEEFAVGGKEVPLYTDPKRWRWVYFQKPGSMLVEHMVGSHESFSPTAFSFDDREPEVLVLNGELDGNRMHAKLVKMALIRDGFHWIFDPRNEEEE